MTSLDDNYAPRCRDERCEVKSSCPLYLDRDNPNARVTAHTLRFFINLYSCSSVDETLEAVQ